jgi:hypothetical protein
MLELVDAGKKMLGEDYITRTVNKEQGNSSGLVLRGLSCPLCNLDLEKEKKYYEDRSFVVLRTKTGKGHRERIMIVFRRHEHTVPQRAFEHALDVLTKIGREVFSYTPKFVIMDTTFATISDHWHLVATDLDPKSEDFNQILGTRWIKVIDNTVMDQSEI